MNVDIIEGVTGAQQAKGIAIIIDVLRAATVSAYLLQAGVDSIIPVATANQAFDHKRANKEVLLVGEDQGIKITGFDIGNSPSEIKERQNLKGKQVIHRSSTGTQGLVHAHQAQQIIFGSFVTAGAIARHVQQFPDQTVTLVPMYALEDQLCAEYLRAALLDKTTQSIQSIKKQVSQSDWIQKSFLDPDKNDFPEEDFHLSFETDVFDFFPIVRAGKIIKNTAV